MSIGQFGPMGGLIMGWHLNANSNDFSGNALHGTDANITYDPATGILGPGALFNGSSSKIVIPAGMWTPISDANFSVAVVIKTPASAPGLQPLFGRSYVQVSTNYYGYVFQLDANSLTYIRNDGSTSAKTVTTPFAFESSKRYLVGLVYEHATGTTSIYCIPLFAGKSKGMGTGTLTTVNVAINATYDQGLNLGANLRNTSNQYCSLTMNEFLVFNKLLPMKWYIDYGAFLRGFK